MVLSQDDLCTLYEQHTEEVHTDPGQSLCGFRDVFTHLCSVNFIFLFASYLVLLT